MKRKSVRIMGIVAALLLVLGVLLVMGEPSDDKEIVVQTTAEPVASPVESIPAQAVAGETKETKEASEKDRPDIEESGEPESSATAEPSATQKPVETEPSCILSICCDEALKNQDVLAEEKREIIPSDGWILQEETVSFTEGETVFDLLLRETKSRGIHFEFVYTPMYQSVYIEGIGNLYEFDCGDTSGWFYKVNGEKPMFGCSQYMLKPGDKVEFVYTCNFLKKQ